MIIGGSVAGISTAVSARRNYPVKNITIIRKEDKVLIPCSIPYIFGTIRDVEKNLIPDVMLSKNKINLIVDEAIDIDREDKKVKTLKREDIKYKKIVLALGSFPVIPSISGVGLNNVFVIKKDVNYLKDMLKSLDSCKKIVVIGGGFIGIEISDELKKRNFDVKIIEMLPHCLETVCDSEFYEKVEEKLKEKGIEIFTNTSVKEIGGKNKVEYVILDSGKRIDADAVIIGIGTRANISLAEKSGLKIGDKGSIWVDEYQKTSDDDIFAVGDCAEKKNLITGKSSGLKLASIATREGRIAGSNLFETRQQNEGTVGVFSTTIDDFALGVAGLTEKVANDAGIEFVKGEFETTDKHPGILPNSNKIHVKLLFEKSEKSLIGGEVWGGPGTAEITNIVSALIQKKSRIDEVIKFQMGTHPILTPSPIVYPIVNAAEIAKYEVNKK